MSKKYTRENKQQKHYLMSNSKVAHDGPSHKIKVDTQKGPAFRESQGLSSSNFSIEDRNTAITDAKWATADIAKEAQANINQSTTPAAWNADWV